MECPGRAHCGDGDDCFAEHARDRREDVDILVVNHALLCAHLASHGNVLPEHDLVILDEAHAFADNATNAFGADLAPDVLVRLSGMLLRAGVEANAVDALATAAKHLGNVVDARDGRIDVEHRRPAAQRAALGRRTAGSRELEAEERRGRQREAHRAAGDGAARGAPAARRSPARRRDVDREGPAHRPAAGRAGVGRRGRRRDAARRQAGDRGVGDAGRRGRRSRASRSAWASTRRPSRASSGATSRCRPRARSTGATRVCCTSARTCPTRGAPTSSGSTRRATGCASS